MFYGRRLATEDATGKKVVIRKFPQMTPELDRFFENEVRVMSSVYHPCLLHMKGYNNKDMNGKHAVIVTDLIEKGTLEDAIFSKLLTPMDKVKVIFGIACGLNALHTNSIVHRNLNPKTVMLNKNKLPVIRKFGLSCSDGMKALEEPSGLEDKLSVFYTAPEVYGDLEEYHASMDIYSFGLIIYQIITGFPPDKGLAPGMIYDYIKGVKSGWRPEIPSNMDSEAVNLITCCWNPDPEMRPTAAGITEKLRELRGQIIHGVNADTFAEYSSSLF